MSRKKKKIPVKLDETMTQCLGILKVLQGKQEAGPFLEPVDWELYGLTDYPEIIKTPMDLGTIQDKLESGKYLGSEAFASDVRLVWKNACRYNRPDSEIYVTADKLSKLFEKRFGKVKKTAPPPVAASPVAAVATVATPAATPGAATAAGDNKRRRPPTPSTAAGGAPSSTAQSSGGNGSSTPKQIPKESHQDRIKFSHLVNQLNPDELGQVVDRIHAEAPDALGEEDDDELEIEINVIPHALLLNLNAFASKCVSQHNTPTTPTAAATSAATPTATATASAAAVGGAPAASNNNNNKKRKL